jgi:hypothetical protein
LICTGRPASRATPPTAARRTPTDCFDKTPQGERYRELTDELWSAIAARFKGNPAVAMYDLLNEPCCDMPVTELQRRINNESIYVRLYDTVRAADPDHIITLECIWTPPRTAAGEEARLVKCCVSGAFLQQFRLYLCGFSAAHPPLSSGHTIDDGRVLSAGAHNVGGLLSHDEHPGFQLAALDIQGRRAPDVGIGLVPEGQQRRL